MMILTSNYDRYCSELCRYLHHFDVPGATDNLMHYDWGFDFFLQKGLLFRHAKKWEHFPLRYSGNRGILFTTNYGLELSVSKFLNFPLLSSSQIVPKFLFLIRTIWD